MNESSSSSLNEATPESGAGLELPDWSGHQPHRSRVPNDKWLAYCRSNLPKLRLRPGHAQIRRQNGIAVEFHL